MVVLDVDDHRAGAGEEAPGRANPGRRAVRAVVGDQQAHRVGHAHTVPDDPVPAIPSHPRRRAGKLRMRPPQWVEILGALRQRPAQPAS